MKIYTFLILALLTACSQDDEMQPMNDIITNDAQSDFWGCWGEASGNHGYYDIVLEYNPEGRHTITLGDDCKDGRIVASADVGYFRGDTLILDDGINQIMCYIAYDTLYYFAELYPLEAERFVKK
jgi:hypothetical protein